VFGLGLFLGALLLALGGREMVVHPSHRRLSYDLLVEGDALLARGDALGAAREYRQAAGLMGGNVVALQRLADALAILGDFPGEVDIRRLLLTGSPNSASAERELGAALLRAGRNAEAAGFLETAVDLDARSVPGWVGLGDALAKEGRGREAILAYKRAIEIAPREPAAQNGLGIALAGEGRLAEALPHFRAAVRSSNDPAVLGNVRRAEAALAEASP
jgi:tetratricopeptide (TPR) repeat protein